MSVANSHGLFLACKISLACETPRIGRNATPVRGSRSPALYGLQDALTSVPIRQIAVKLQDAHFRDCDCTHTPFGPNGLDERMWCKYAFCVYRVIEQRQAILAVVFGHQSSTLT